MPDSRQIPETTTEPGDSGAGFLLAEYDRLKNLQNTMWEIYYTRFNSYMTITLAIIGGYLTIATATKSNIPATSPVPEILLGVLFVWGILTFLDMADLSQSINHHIRAMRDIQRYFTDRSTDLVDYLYYSKPALYKPPSRLRGFVVHWLGGSPKMVLAVLNATMGALLLAIFLLSLGFLPWLTAVLALIAFFVLGAGHAAYVSIVYRRRYIP